MNTKEILSNPCVIAVIFSTPLITTSLIGILSQTLLAQSAPANLLTYQNSTAGITLQYPSNWVKQENGTRQDTQTDLVTFTPPTINSNASLDITVDDITDSMGTTLAQYASDEIGSLKQQFASNDFKLIESKSSIILAGLPAYRIVYTSVDQNTTTKDMEIGAIKGGKVYLLTYETGPNEYDKYLPIALKMIDSFKLIK
ncbi:MAG: PsbP-related protein [Candidatus Nitrosopolaris sp.]